MHAGIDERLHQQEDIRRSGARERGGHVEVRLVLDHELLAEGGEDLFRPFALRGRHRRRRVPRGHAHPDLRRRVRHRAHDRGVREPGLERAHRRARDDREHELLRGQLPVELLHHRRQHLRLHRENDDSGIPRRVGVGGERRDRELLRELRAALAARAGDGHVRRRDDVAVEDRADHRLAHHATAEERDPVLRHHGIMVAFARAAERARQLVQ